MSHYDYPIRPSYVVFVCAFILCLVALYVNPNGAGFILLACALIGWGIVINARENEQSERAEQKWKRIASGLADQLRDRQEEAGYYQHASAVIDMLETIHGGRVYHGPVTAADIHEPLLTNGEDAA